MLRAAILALIIAPVAHSMQLAVQTRSAVADVNCSVQSFTWTDATGAQGSVPFAAAIDVPDRPIVLKASSDKCWAETDSVSTSTRSITVELWPATTIHGEFVVPDRTPLPTHVSGVFVDPSGPAAEHPLDCEIQGKEWTCAAPAHRPMHLKLSAEHFTPLYFWDTDAPAGDYNAGPRTLVRGASVAGRVVTDRHRPIENATVTLSPITAVQQSAPDRVLSTLKTKTNASGWFQFAGVEPGRYRIISSIAGRADATQESIDVAPLREVVLNDPLINLLPARLEVVIQPPVSPSQQRWTVRLDRLGKRTSEVIRVAESAAGVDGIWARDGLDPDSYLVRVLDAEESELGREGVIIRGANERVVININAMEVRGRLLSGDDGVEARIQFDIATHGRRVNATSGRDGTFTATFPVKGEWRPLILRDRGSRVELPLVEIPRTDGSELVLHLPPGGVKGKVLDGNGRSADRAVVSLFDKQHVEGQTLTDSDGSFDLNGIAPGTYTIEAETDDEYAGPIEVTVGEQKRAEVELRCGKFGELRGTIYTPSGNPASGAIVRRVEPESGVYDDTIADARGMFRIPVKPHAEAIDIVVIDPPYPVAVRHVPLAKRNPPLDVRLSAVGALLRILVLRTPPWPTIAASGGPVVALPHMLIPRFGSGLPRELNNGIWELNVEPGAYVVCTSTRDECRSLQLAPATEMLANLAVSQAAETKGKTR